MIFFEIQNKYSNGVIATVGVANFARNDFLLDLIQLECIKLYGRIKARCLVEFVVGKPYRSPQKHLCFSVTDENLTSDVILRQTVLIFPT